VSSRPSKQESPPHSLKNAFGSRGAEIHHTRAFFQRLLPGVEEECFLMSRADEVVIVA